MLAPAVKPVVIQTSTIGEDGTKHNVPTASVRRQDEKDKVNRAVEAMAATGVRFERSRVENDPNARGGSWVYRMEPGLEGLVGFDTMNTTGNADTVRYAVRQVLEGEWMRRTLRKTSGVEHIVGRDKKKESKEEKPVKDDVKRDFFGRTVKDEVSEKSGRLKSVTAMAKGVVGKEGRVWVSYHEGYSNAVRRPITFDELMRGF
jgi:chromosome transmission fidelity protein 18